MGFGERSMAPSPSLQTTAIARKHDDFQRDEHVIRFCCHIMLMCADPLLRSSAQTCHCRSPLPVSLKLIHQNDCLSPCTAGSRLGSMCRRCNISSSSILQGTHTQLPEFFQDQLRSWMPLYLNVEIHAERSRLSSVPLGNLSRDERDIWQDIHPADKRFYLDSFVFPDLEENELLDCI